MIKKGNFDTRILMTLLMLVVLIVVVTAINLPIQSCVAEQDALKGSFGGSCDDPTGNSLLSDDSNLETHTYDKNVYAGVKIESYNSSVTDCESIDGVELCYKWWATSITRAPTDCDVSVDSDGGSSYNIVTTTCPGTSEPGSATCTDVTSLETWDCENFFGSSGTRALAKSELSRVSSGPGSTETATWDVLYFDVNYTSSSACENNITNTSWSNWMNLSCLPSDLMNQSRNRIQYDANNCGNYTNETIVEYRATESCNYNSEENVTINESVEDAQGNPLNITLEIIDEQTNSTIYNNTGNLHNPHVPKNKKYHIYIKPKNHKIKKIEFNSLNLTNNLDQLIDIDDPANNQNFNELYAINPVANLSGNTTFDVTIDSASSSGVLYKCNDWNFTNQSCYGEWKAIKAITEGQEYTITLSLNDPGLGEGNGTFFEDWESGSLATNNWNVTNGPTSGWSVSTSEGPRGTYHAMARNTDGETILENNVSTLGYENINFSFWWATDSNLLESGEYFRVDWYNGASWTNILNFTTGSQTSYTFENFALNSSADDNDNLRIRFRCNANLGTEGCNVDDIQIEGVVIASDTEEPTFDAGSPYDMDVYDNESVSQQINATDNVAIDCFRINDTDFVINCTGYFENSSVLNVGAYALNVTVNDTSGNENSSVFYINVSDSAVSDTEAPTYSNLIEPSDPSTYSPGANYQFNVTWNDNVGVETVLLDFDGTNYSVSNSGTEYFRTFADLAAGSYNYRWYANDSSGNSNATSLLSFTINKASQTVTLGFDPVSPISYGTAVNVACNGDLFRDGSNVTSEIGVNVTLGVGSYDYSCKLYESQNYSYDDDNSTYVVNQAAPVITLNAAPSWTVIDGTQTNVSCSADNSEVNISLYREGSLIGSSVGGIVSDVQTLAADTYDYICNNSATQNYSAGSENNQLSVTSKTVSNCSLVFDKASPQTYGTAINASCSCDNPEASEKLFRDEIDVTATENNQLITLGVDTYDYVCNVSETQNYSSASNSSSYIINKASGVVNLLLNGSSANLTIERKETVNQTGILVSGAGNIQMYQQGGLINSGSSPLENITQFNSVEDYNVTVIYGGNENYTSASEIHWIIVQDTINPDSITGLTNQSRGDDFIYWSWTNPSDDDFSESVVYLNGAWKANTTNNYYNATNLNPNSTHTITVHTKDDSGNINDTDVNSTSKTTGTTSVGGEDILFEGWESGALFTNGWVAEGAGNKWDIGSTNQRSGSFNVEIIDTGLVGQPTTLYATIDTSGYENITISYYRKLVSLDAGDDFIVDWFNGVGWATAEQLGSGSANDGDYVYKTYDLGTSADNNPDFRLRFSCEAPGATEGCRLDDITISGDLIDETAPSFSSYVEGPVNASSYSQGQTYYFNVTITEANGIDSTGIEFDGVNYSVSNIGNVYMFNRNDLAVGSYSYYWWANDTIGNFNTSEIRVYTINKAPQTATLGFEPVSPITYETAVNVTCNGDLFRDGSNVTSEIGTNVTLAAGSYDYSCKLYESQNYSYDDDNLTYVVNKETTNLNLLVSPAWTAVDGTQTNVSCSADNSEVNISLYREGSLIGSSVGGIVSDVQTLAADTYDYICNNSATQNYSSAFQINYLEITSKNVSTCSLVFDKASPQIYETAINASCSCDNPEASEKLFRDEIDVTATENNQLITLGVDTYDYVCNVSETQNYSSASNSSSYIINKASGDVNLLLNGASDNLTLEASAVSNISASTSYGYITIYRNGTNITSENNQDVARSQGYYNITAISSGDENHTSVSTILWLNMTPPTGPIISIVRPEAITYTDNESLPLNYSVSDNNGVDSCWYNIDGGNNVSLSGCSNTTFDVPDSGNYVLRLFSNDSLGNENSESIDFSVDLVGVSISLVEPSGTKTSRQGIAIEYTVAGNNLSCWYNVKTSIGGDVLSNTTLFNCDNSTFDVAVDGDYVLNLFVNNTLGSFASDSNSFTVDTDDGGSGGSGGSGGGGGESSKTTIIIKNNLTSDIEFKQIPNSILTMLEKKNLLISVTNIGDIFLNDCRLNAKGSFRKWFNPGHLKKIKDLAAGEEYDFMLELEVPEEASPGQYDIVLSLECNNYSEIISFNVEVIEKKIDFILGKFERTADDEIKIDYTLKELAGINQDLNLQFLILDNHNNKVAETLDIISLTADLDKEYSIVIPISPDLKGKLTLLVNLNSEIYSSFVKEEVVLTPISGFTIFGETQRTDQIISRLLIGGFVLFTIFIIVRILRHKRKKKLHSHYTFFLE